MLFQIVPFEQIKLDNSAQYLVRGIIPRWGLVLVWGPPKCGKSFWVFDLLMHIALGWDYRGRRVKQGAIVYCAPEGAHGFRARKEAFKQAYLADRVELVPFYLVPTKLALVKDHEALIRSIRDKLIGPVLAAVAIDTLNRSISGSESDDRDMGAYLDAAEAIAEAFGCAVIIIHHCGHEGTRPRGHSSITGTIEAQIAVKRDEAGKITALVEDMKDGPDGTQIVSYLETVQVGFDEDGEPIASCIIVPVEGVAAPGKTARAKLTKAAKIALRALREAISERGEIPPASNHIPRNVKAVKVDEWRDYAFRQGISGSDERRARNAAFQRAHEALESATEVAV
jgi:AAA domain